VWAPQCVGDPEICVHGVHACYPIIHAWVCPKGEKRCALYARLLAKQLCMGAQLCGGQARCDACLCT
jgi:hypothetical protein